MLHHGVDAMGMIHMNWCLKHVWIHVGSVWLQMMSQVHRPAIKGRLNNVINSFVFRKLLCLCVCMWTFIKALCASPLISYHTVKEMESGKSHFSHLVTFIIYRDSRFREQIWSLWASCSLICHTPEFKGYLLHKYILPLYCSKLGCCMRVL